MVGARFIVHSTKEGARAARPYLETKLKGKPETGQQILALALAPALALPGIFPHAHVSPCPRAPSFEIRSAQRSQISNAYPNP